jgi:hypothetical protein
MHRKIGMDIQVSTFSRLMNTASLETIIFLKILNSGNGAEPLLQRWI